MDSAAEVDHCLGAFFSGRLSFEKLVVALKSIVAESHAEAVVVERLQYWVDLGRLPADLKGHLGAELESARPAALQDYLDQPTVPLVRPPQPASASPVPPVAAPPPVAASPPAMPSPAMPAMPMPGAMPISAAMPLPGALPAGGMALPKAETMRDKVDEVVVNALLGGFTNLRGRDRDAGPREDPALDANLADFRSLRFRRDASNAEAGRARRFELDPRQESRSIGTGAMLKDRFVLDSEIGRGGMGVVYRAVDRRRLEAMHRQPYVAVKLLSGDFRHHPEALRTLEAEARKAQELAHPNIVTVHDFERDGSHLFIVMELLEGQPLDRVLADLQGAPMPVAQAGPIIRGLCAGLGHAHDRGVIHADLKPANIFVGANLAVKLLDFGIASATRDSGFDPASLGGMTLPYASPGMLEGRPREPRDDIYALGCIVHLLLSGNHPFGLLPALDAREAQLTPRRPEGLSNAAWQVLLSAMAFEAESRPADAGAFQQAFFAAAPFGG